MTKEDLKKYAKLASQEAWTGEHRTSVNDMIEFIVCKVSEHLLDEIEDLRGEVKRLLKLKKAA